METRLDAMKATLKDFYLPDAIVEPVWQWNPHSWAVKTMREIYGAATVDDFINMIAELESKKREFYIAEAIKFHNPNPTMA